MRISYQSITSQHSSVFNPFSLQNSSASSHVLQEKCLVHHLLGHTMLHIPFLLPLFLIQGSTHLVAIMVFAILIHYSLQNQFFQSCISFLLTKNKHLILSPFIFLYDIWQKKQKMYFSGWWVKIFMFWKIKAK